MPAASMPAERTQICCVTSVLGAVLLAAAIEGGVLDPDPGRRVLLVANTAGSPEVVTAAQDVPGFAALARHFDEVLDWNAVVAPLHPAGWYPSAVELPLLSRLLRYRLGLERGCTDLVVDGLDTLPGRAIAALLPGPVTVLSDSLLAWGPPATPLTSAEAGRAERLLHLPVLAGLRPLLLAEAPGHAHAAVPADRLIAALAELPATPVPDHAVLLVGEAPGISDPTGAELLRRAAAHGARDAVLVPHPRSIAGADHVTLRALADELGVRLVITDDGLPAEAVLARSQPALVVGGISATLAVARDVFGRPVATVGAEQVLARRKPGPQRVAASIVHAGVPALSPDGVLIEPPPVDLAALVNAVAYSLASDALAELRPAAAEYLRAHGSGPYVTHDRLVALGFVEAGDPPAARRTTPTPARHALRRLGRTGRR